MNVDPPHLCALLHEFTSSTTPADQFTASMALNSL